MSSAEAGGPLGSVADPPAEGSYRAAELVELGCLVRELEFRLTQARLEGDCRSAERRSLSARMERLRRSLVYRGMRRLGLWSWLDLDSRPQSAPHLRGKPLVNA